MKKILVLATMFFTCHANASLVVGDLVQYQMTVSTAAYSQVMQEKIEVTAINPSQGTYTSNITVTFNGMQISQSSVNSNLNSAEVDETTVGRCSQISGATIETITVSAGSFKVCHISNQQGDVKYDYFMGSVLFGLVKSVTMDSASGTTTTLELIQYIKH